MASLNKVFLIGNLTRDPEIRYTPGGSPICSMGLATNRKYTTSKGEERDETCFVDIDIWGKQAESSHAHLRKGAPVFIEGRLRYDQWDDKETGRKRSRLLVTAERVQFLSQQPRSSDYAPSSNDYTNNESQNRPYETTSNNQSQLNNTPAPPPFPTDDNMVGKSTNSENSENQTDESIDDIPF